MAVNAVFHLVDNENLSNSLFHIFPQDKGTFFDLHFTPEWVIIYTKGLIKMAFSLWKYTKMDFACQEDYRRIIGLPKCRVW